MSLDQDLLALNSRLVRYFARVDGRDKLARSVAWVLMFFCAGGNRVDLVTWLQIWERLRFVGADQCRKRKIQAAYASNLQVYMIELWCMHLLAFSDSHVTKTILHPSNETEGTPMTVWIFNEMPGRRVKAGCGVARKIFRIGAPTKDIDAIANLKVTAECS
jgi:hypothetical protein